MIDALGFIYDVAKDIKEHFAWKDEDKLVEITWPQSSGFENEAKKAGYDIGWTRLDRVETKKLEGYDVMFELDKAAGWVLIQEGVTHARQRLRAAA